MNWARKMIRVKRDSRYTFTSETLYFKQILCCCPLHANDVMHRNCRIIGISYITISLCEMYQGMVTKLCARVGYTSLQENKERLTQNTEKCSIVSGIFQHEQVNSAHKRTKETIEKQQRKEKNIVHWWDSRSNEPLRTLHWKLEVLFCRKQVCNEWEQLTASICTSFSEHQLLHWSIQLTDSLPLGEDPHLHLASITGGLYIASKTPAVNGIK